MKETGMIATASTSDLFKLNRVLHRLGFQHNKAEFFEGRIEGAFRSEDLGVEGRDCDDCDEECECQFGSQWDEIEARVSQRAMERLRMAFPEPAKIDLNYEEKGWYGVSITLVERPAPRATVFRPDGKPVEVTIPRDDKSLAHRVPEISTPKPSPAKPAAGKAKKLTPKQTETVAWVRDTENPTGDDATTRFALTNAAARDRLERLRKRGLLEIFPGPTGKRTYRVTPEGLALLNEAGK